MDIGTISLEMKSGPLMSYRYQADVKNNKVIKWFYQPCAYTRNGYWQLYANLLRLSKCISDIVEIFTSSRYKMTHTDIESISNDNNLISKLYRFDITKSDIVPTSC